MLSATIQQRRKRSSAFPRARPSLEASVLGRSFSRHLDPPTAPGTRRVGDRLLAEGFSKRKRSRGDGCILERARGEVLYVLSRDARGGRSSEVSGLVESGIGAGSTGSTRARPHFSQGDVLEKTSNMMISSKSLRRSARTTRFRAKTRSNSSKRGMDRRRAREGEARLLMARQTMAGNPDAVSARRMRQSRCSSGEATRRRPGPIVFAATRHGRDARPTRRDRGRARIESRTRSRRPNRMKMLLSSASAGATLRGNTQKAGAYVAEIDRLNGRAGAERRSRGREPRRRDGNPIETSTSHFRDRRERIVATSLRRRDDRFPWNPVPSLSEHVAQG